MSNIYLTAEEASKILKLSRPTLYKLARENKINSIKIGGNIVFPKSSIENYASITIEECQITNVSKPKKEINYWMIPRSVRKLVTLQEMIKDDYRNGIIGEQWKGTRTNHLKRDKNLQTSGLRGKSPEGFVDSNPGGARTDVALLAALGFYAFDKQGNIELTFQGEQMLISNNPSSIITEQLFQFRYPSPYSKSIHMNSEFDIFPYRFLFKLLLSDELMDDGSIIADDNIIRLTQNEIACFVITEAKKNTDINKVIQLIVNSRKTKEPLNPSSTLKNIANTFINNIEITGFIERNKKSSINIKDNSINAVLDLIEKKPRNFKYEIGKENEFQHRLGMNPKKSKFTKSQTSNRKGGELAVQHLLNEELRNNPMTIEMITPELISDISQRAGTSINITTEVINSVLQEDPQNIFAQQYLEYSSSGRNFAREFEISTSKIFKEIFGNSKWTGKEGKSPDVTFKIKLPNVNETKNGIIDCKAEKKYNISNDHFNRMTVEDTGYIPAYNADFFIYVANDFGTTFDKNLKRIESKTNIKGSGIRAKELLYLLEKHRKYNFKKSNLLSLFTIGRIITIGDINILFNNLL